MRRQAGSSEPSAQGPAGRSCAGGRGATRRDAHCPPARQARARSRRVRALQLPRRSASRPASVAHQQASGPPPGRRAADRRGPAPDPPSRGPGQEGAPAAAWYLAEPGRPHAVAWPPPGPRAMRTGGGDAQACCRGVGGVQGVAPVLAAAVPQPPPARPAGRPRAAADKSTRCFTRLSMCTRLQDGAPSWALVDDVFGARYLAGVTHTAGAWAPLPRASLQLEPSGAAAAAGAAASPMAATLRSVPETEPWLLAAGALAEAGGWAAAARSSRARLLFQYRPYCQQERLEVGSAEVAAVVEAVFGRAGGPGPSAFQARTMRRALPLPACWQRAATAGCTAGPLPAHVRCRHLPLPTTGLQAEAGALWDSVAGDAAPGLAPAAASTGEMAAVVLIKLLLDLYVTAGPKASFPLALMLLQARSHSGATSLWQAGVPAALHAALPCPAYRWLLAGHGACFTSALPCPVPLLLPQKPLLEGEAAEQARVFDLLYNLSIHGELLYDAAAEAVPEDAPALADAGARPGGGGLRGCCCQRHTQCRKRPAAAVLPASRRPLPAAACGPA